MVEILLSCRGYPPGTQPTKPGELTLPSGAAVRVKSDAIYDAIGDC